MRIVKPVEEEREEIGSILDDLAEYYGVTLSSKRKELFIDDLLEMGPGLTRTAAIEYRLGWVPPHQFPYPAQLRQKVCFTTSTMSSWLGVKETPANQS